MALEEIKGLIDSGKYQDAYDTARMQGYDPARIAEYVNDIYGTTNTAESLAKDYEGQSQRNLREQGYGYATYDNGLGAGKALKLGSPLAMGVGAIADPLAAAPDYSGMATTVGQGMGQGQRGNAYYTVPGTASSGAVGVTPAAQSANPDEYLNYLKTKVIDPTLDTYVKDDMSDSGYRYNRGPTIEGLTQEDYSKLPSEFEKWQNRDQSIDPKWAYIFNKMNDYHEGRFAPGKGSLDLAKRTLQQWMHDAEPGILDKVANIAIPMALSAAAGNVAGGLFSPTGGALMDVAIADGAAMANGAASPLASLAKAITSPSTYAQTLGRAAANSAITGSPFNPVDILKNMGVNFAGQGVGAGVQGLTQDVGDFASQAAGALANAGVNSALTGQPLDINSLLKSEGMNYLDQTTGLPISTLEQVRQLYSNMHPTQRTSGGQDLSYQAFLRATGRK